MRRSLELCWWRTGVCTKRMMHGGSLRVVSGPCGCEQRETPACLVNAHLLMYSLVSYTRFHQAQLNRLRKPPMCASVPQTLVSCLGDLGIDLDSLQISHTSAINMVDNGYHEVSPEPRGCASIPGASLQEPRLEREKSHTRLCCL